MKIINEGISGWIMNMSLVANEENFCRRPYPATIIVPTYWCDIMMDEWSILKEVLIAFDDKPAANFRRMLKYNEDCYTWWWCRCCSWSLDPIKKVTNLDMYIFSAMISIGLVVDCFDVTERSRENSFVVNWHLLWWSWLVQCDQSMHIINQIFV